MSDHKFNSFEVDQIISSLKDSHYWELKVKDSLLKEAEEKAEKEFDKFHSIFKFMTDCEAGTESAIAFVEYTFESARDKKEAAKAVSFVHEEIVDLSTIECSKEFFKPWG